MLIIHTTGCGNNTHNYGQVPGPTKIHNSQKRQQYIQLRPFKVTNKYTQHNRCGNTTNSQVQQQYTKLWPSGGTNKYTQQPGEVIIHKTKCNNNTRNYGGGGKLIMRYQREGITILQKKTEVRRNDKIIIKSTLLRYSY